jgi:hypothetical protein
MATENLVWEDNTLYQWNEALSYRQRAVCQLYWTDAGFYRINFYTPVDGQHIFAPYPSLEEAKAAALAIYKLS